MNLAVKVALYFVLTTMVVVFGQRFVASLSRTVDRQSALDNRYQLEPNAPSATNATALDVADAINAATNASAETSTNQSASDPAVASVTASTNAPPPGAAPARPAKPASQVGLYGALGLLSLLALALLTGYDVSHYLAGRAQRELFNDDGEGMHDPEYDAAEQVWADGDHLEAIRLMRDYFRKNPSELHVSIRIAEIYEKDLNNPLAAALEYEEVLQRRFDPERWGWTAIHLCNLYARLNNPSRMEELMRRIVQEFPQTGAAKKAREKLGLPEGGNLAADAPTETPAVPDAESPLPRGFKPRKG